MTELQRNFENRVNQSVKQMLKLGYKSTIFETMRQEHGTIDAIKRLVVDKKISEGFKFLWEHKRLDLSVENIILEPEWNSLFSDSERTAAKNKLQQCGFKI